MVSVKLKFRSSSIDVNLGSLYYQVVYKRVVRQISTPYKIMKKEWDASSCTLLIKVNDKDRYNYLQVLQKRIQWDKKKLMKIIDLYINSGIAFSVDSIVEAYKNEINDMTLFKYTDKLVSKLQNNGQIRTSETYKTTLNSFKSFMNGHDVSFFELDADLLKSYECYLKTNNLSMNTVSFYMRRLRAIYNKAVDDKIVEQHNPFKKVYTGTEKR